MELEFAVSVFMEGVKPENPEKNARFNEENQQQTQPTCGTGPKSSPCRIGGSRALPPLRHPCSDRVCKEEDQKGFAPLSKCFPERYVSPTSFSLNLLAFCRECFSLLGYLLSLISVVDSEQLSGVQLLTKYWPALCIFEVSVKRIKMKFRTTY